MKKEKLNPVLAFEDQQAVDISRNLITEELYNAVTRLVNAFNDLNLGELQEAELPRLIEAPGDFVKGKCADAIGEVPEFGGFKMKRDTLINQLDLPDITHVKEAAAACIKAKGSRPAMFYSMYEISGRAVKVKTEQLEKYLDGSRTYATNEDEIKVLEHYNAFLKAYNDFDALLRSRPVTSGGLKAFPFQSLLNRDPRNGGDAISIHPGLYNALMNPRSFNS